MTGLLSKPLKPETWPDFVRLVEAHDGVWGGCWCMAFHPPRGGGPYTAEDNRTAKEERVRAAAAHAALVYDGVDCVGWCQFGPPAELPRIKHRRAYEATSPELPDWRITCFFVAKTHRKSGVASTALDGALTEIARLGGGTVQSSPEDVTNRSVSSSFLYNATLSLFEAHGFERTCRLGKNHWLVTKVVAPDRG